MYTIEDIKKMNQSRQDMISNYIKKFLDSRWREEDECTLEDALKFAMVQSYIECVDHLPITKETEIILNVGCGGTCDGN